MNQLLKQLQALSAALNKPVAEAMGAAEAKYLAHLSVLSPSLLLAEWKATEEASHFEPESYKPEYVRLLLQALCAALAPQWVAMTERLPKETGVYLVFGNCTDEENSPPTEDMATFYIEAAIFSKYRQPTHWMPLPAPPAPMEKA